MTGPGHRNNDLVLVLLLITTLVCSGALSSWLDTNRRLSPEFGDEEQLVINANGLKRVSLGLNGLAADWYWLRALQYVGRRILRFQGPVELDNLGPVGLTQLAPLLEATTDLDPHFAAAYEYGAALLPSFDPRSAINLLKKGIAVDAQNWRLYNQLGYVYWQQGKHRDASDAYTTGARLPGAPSWMELMAVRVASDGSSRTVARETYRNLYNSSDDKNVRALALRRLQELESH
jgi:hypothetical protein